MNGLICTVILTYFLTLNEAHETHPDQIENILCRRDFHDFERSDAAELNLIRSMFDESGEFPRTRRTSRVSY